VWAETYRIAERPTKVKFADARQTREVVKADAGGKMLFDIVDQSPGARRHEDLASAGQGQGTTGVHNKEPADDRKPNLLKKEFVPGKAGIDRVTVRRGEPFEPEVVAGLTVPELKVVRRQGEKLRLVGEGGRRQADLQGPRVSEPGRPHTLLGPHDSNRTGGKAASSDGPAITDAMHDVWNRLNEEMIDSQRLIGGSNPVALREALSFDKGETGPAIPDTAQPFGVLKASIVAA
jgi:hypothetical protein